MYVPSEIYVKLVTLEEEIEKVQKEIVAFTYKQFPPIDIEYKILLSKMYALTQERDILENNIGE